MGVFFQFNVSELRKGTNFPYSNLAITFIGVCHAREGELHDLGSGPRYVMITSINTHAALGQSNDNGRIVVLIVLIFAC